MLACCTSPWLGLASIVGAGGGNDGKMRKWAGLRTNQNTEVCGENQLEKGFQAGYQVRRPEEGLKAGGAEPGEL